MIKLPSLFAEKLTLNSSLLADVQSTFAAFSPWLANSGMPFFPGFTDHSPTHINDVLSSAASLISDSSHELITPEDVSVLCIAILLHDAGMHLTADSFRALVKNSSAPIVNGFGDIPWDHLWKDFLAEAHRFGQEKLIAIFGDAAPLRLDNLDLENLTEKDHLLIGEFVRRHHTRIAHEIALVGIGRQGGQPIKLIGFNDAICDIAGLVARSHGMPIRNTFDYLKSKYGNIAVCRKIKVPYLMAILGIADYIQVKSERAIAGLLSVKELRSPISRQEWRNHFAIADVHTYHADPEAIFVEAAPVDVRTFAKLSNLFKDIQRELDESWATLGEVYGRMNGLDKLGLNSRRVRSTLDSFDEFSKTVPYVPINARFDSSGPELLKLLVGPLYDYQLSVGIRELMQNAIDACREAQDLYSKRGIEHIQSEKPDVTIEIIEEDDGSGYVLISDNGVGMTVETITRYFLIAGASFRNSDVWKRQHTDRSGRSKIARGGRFGIGALAAFLLGEEIIITTRHIDRPSHEGITFSAKIDDPHVQLTKCTAPQGTSFKVCVNDPNVFNQLRPSFTTFDKESKPVKLASWHVVDWFVQECPSVLIKWSGFNVGKSFATQHQREQIRVTAEFSPPIEDLVPNDPNKAHGQSWNRLVTLAEYQAILWKYKEPVQTILSNETVLVAPVDEVVVNGLRVQSLSGRNSRVVLPEGERDFGPQYNVDRPSVAIYDPSGVCPINLQRSKVAFDRMGIDEHLLRDILLFQISNFVKASSLPSTVGEFYKLCETFSQIQGMKFEGQVSPLAIVDGGLVILDPSVLDKVGVKNLFVIDPAASDFDVPLASLRVERAAISLRVAEYSNGTQSLLSWFRGVFTPRNIQYYSRNIGFPRMQPNLQMSIMPSKRWSFASARGKVARYIVEPLRTKTSAEKTIVYLGDETDLVLLQPIVENFSAKFSETAEVVVWEISKSNVTHHTSILAACWIEVAGGPVLSLPKSKCIL